LREYSQQLNKWHKRLINIAIGTLELIKNDLPPVTIWILGRIVYSDGLIRVVTVNSQLAIPQTTSKICPFPVQSSEEKSSIMDDVS